MTAAGTATLPTTQAYRCECGQVLAQVGERGAVYPVIIGTHVDAQGRLVVRCPACHEERRLPIRRRA